MSAAPVNRLTDAQQVAALAEWGRADSFRCCVCQAEATRLGGVIHTAPGVGMAACGPCYAKAARSPEFHDQARARAEVAAWRTTWQRVADLAGVPGVALLAAVDTLRAQHLPVTGPQLDARLSVPPGTIDSALTQVLKVGRPQ
jgi:hypothetical protein